MKRCVIGLMIVLAFLLAPALAQAQATLTVTPSSGPLGTRFVTAVAGLEPNREYRFIVRDPAGETHALTFQTALAGRYTNSWDSAPGEPAGVYTVQVDAG